MSLRILYRAAKGEWEDAVKEMYRPIAEASTGAIRDAAEIVKARGRADIASAGFGPRWQNTLRVDVYPAGNQVSANAAAFVYHKIPYAGVFAEGATIRGKPYLWLPLETTPKKIGRKRMTAEMYRKEVGPLHFIKRSGQRPLLGAHVRMSKKKASEDRPRLTLPMLRKGKSGGGKSGILKSVPLFVGVESVNIRKRFNIYRIIEDTARQLAELYVKNFRPDRG